jgi:hypothetical protein
LGVEDFGVALVLYSVEVIKLEHGLEAGVVLLEFPEHKWSEVKFIKMEWT